MPINVAAQIEVFGREEFHALDKKFGSRWGRGAGDFLRQKLFSRGGLLTHDEIMQQATGEPLTAKYLIEVLRPPGEDK